jgi:hypothetical protein
MLKANKSIKEFGCIDNFIGNNGINAILEILLFNKTLE